ncbi:hypothetical protein J2S09_005120 [Bacillus fengqiuensis]|nr:hypothetical protein [Bacillus fengqiuensis]
MELVNPKKYGTGDEEYFKRKRPQLLPTTAAKQ